MVSSPPALQAGDRGAERILPRGLRSEMADAFEFGSLDEAYELLGLMMITGTPLAPRVWGLLGFEVASNVAHCMISPTI